ncbi:MAG: heme-copper oxidase subunit III [Chloroflexi bacterium]|nr:heme-copper oxidase subunit III [Chloroflexota bacterium]
MAGHVAMGAGHGGTEPDVGLEAIRRVDPNVLGVIVFITSEALFFASLIITYIVYRGASTAGPTPKEVLNVPVTGVFTVFLLSSSLTMARVTAHLSRGDAAAVRRWLILTIVLGAIFLAGQGYEYVRLYLENVTISRNLWGSTFFTLTGFHGLHVLVGLISMAILAGLVEPGGQRVRGASGVEAISFYWHFVDAVWVVIFPVVYLWTLIS